MESDEEQIATSTPIANSSSETPTPEEKRRGGFYDSSSTGRSYFENIWFWIHAAGTIVIALVIGLQIV